MKSILCVRKILLPTFLALVFSIVIVSVGMTSPVPRVTAANSTTMVYVDPPSITGVTINETFTVNINIADGIDIYSWQAGMLFNATVLECTGFFEGDFLSKVADTYWIPGTINNTAGVITFYGSTLLGANKTSGAGRLAYATFKVKAPGVSDLHLRDVLVMDVTGEKVAINIIDVYTVVVNATAHKVVTVSNSTDVESVWDPEAWAYVTIHSGFYNHAFSMADKEISFKVTGPHPGWSNVTIPKALLPPPDLPYVWAVLIDGSWLSTEEITVTSNATHTFIYFTYGLGVHTVQITTRFTVSTISIALSPTSIVVGSNVTISGGIDPVRPGVTVTILYRLSGDVEWTTLHMVLTDSNGNYTSSWTPETAGTYEVMARWEGDEYTLGDESDVQTLTVKGAAGIDPYLIAAAAVVIIIIAAIAVYFVKIRKSKP